MPFGFYYNSFQREAFPHPRDVRDLKSGWWFVFPSMHDEIDCIQIDKKCFLSIGAHAIHGNVLVSRNHVISYERAQEISDYISYLFDCPTAVTHPYQSKDKKNLDSFLSGIRPVLNVMGCGPVKDPKTEFLNNLEAQYDVLGFPARDEFMRIMPLPAPKSGKVIACHLAAKARLLRALRVYKQALLSIEPSGQILNYWRAIEAVQPNRRDQERILSSMFVQRLLPLPVTRFSINGRKQFNLMTHYRKFLKRHFDRLIINQKNTAGVLKYLWEENRHPSAHADRAILIPSAQRRLATILKDALLLKYFARAAIEEYGHKVTP